MKFKKAVLLLTVTAIITCGFKQREAIDHISYSDIERIINSSTESVFIQEQEDIQQPDLPLPSTSVPTQMEKIDHNGYKLMTPTIDLTGSLATGSWKKYRDIAEVSLSNHQNQKYPIDIELILAIIKVESSGNRNAVSSSNAVGLMQIIPSWHADEFKRDMKKHGINIADVNQSLRDEFMNIDYGTYYLSILLDTFDGDYKKAIQAYNMGENSIIDLIENYNQDWYEHKSEKTGDPNYFEKVYKEYKSIGGDRF